MKTHLPPLALVTLALVCLSVATAVSKAEAQVFWTVYPNPAPLEQTLQLKIDNQTRSSITLTSSAPWTIFTAGGSPIMLPVGLPVIVVVKPLASATWNWTQIDSNSAQVPPGWYEARINYSDTSGQKLLRAPFEIQDVTFKVSGQATPGGRVQLDMHTPTSTGAVYQMACALGATPGLPIPATRHLALNPDALFFLSITNPGGVFQNFTGITSKSGYATGFVNIPKAPGLVGVKFYAAGVTLNATAPGGIQLYSASKAVSIL